MTKDVRFRLWPVLGGANRQRRLKRNRRSQESSLFAAKMLSRISDNFLAVKSLAARGILGRILTKDLPGFKGAGGDGGECEGGDGEVKDKEVALEAGVEQTADEVDGGGGSPEPGHLATQGPCILTFPSFLSGHCFLQLEQVALAERPSGILSEERQVKAAL